MRKLMGFIILFLILGCSNANSDSIRIAVISDIHFLSHSLVDGGAAANAFEMSIGRNTDDLHNVLDKVLGNLLEKNIDVLLISGDLSNHGEKQSHLDLIEKLRILQENNVEVFVIPGNHDVNIPDSKAYIGDKAISVESISSKEFTELYESFGYGNAIMRDDSTLSYLAEIDENTWLLAIDTNKFDEYTTSSITSGRIKPETLEWALKVLELAKLKNITVLGIMHHGLVEHMPYQNAFFPNYLIENWQDVSDKLADAGLKVVFTGHFHSNDVTLRTTVKGNTIYDVQTASLSQYPFAYRVMELSDSELFIDSYFISSIPSNINLETEYRQKLESITYRVAYNRIKNLGITMPEKMVEALTNVIVRLNLAHVRGDEKPDPEMMMSIRVFAALLGNEIEIEDYSFDFPPADNKLVIELERD